MRKSRNSNVAAWETVGVILSQDAINRLAHAAYESGGPYERDMMLRALASVGTLPVNRIRANRGDS